MSIKPIAHARIADLKPISRGRFELCRSGTRYHIGIQPNGSIRILSVSAARAA